MKQTTDVRLGAFPETLADLAVGSASLVVADPPWGNLEIWSALGRFAEGVLKPNGILLAYMGNRWCFEAMDLLSRHLSRVRLAFLPVQHLNPWDPDLKCLEQGSFMIIMVNGDFDPQGPWQNAFNGDVMGRRWHPYQRPLANVMHYVEAFSKSGDLVIDPFLGSGTTAVACVKLGRRFVGCDNDPAALQATRDRLSLLDS